MAISQVNNELFLYCIELRLYRAYKGRRKVLLYIPGLDSEQAQARAYAIGKEYTADKPFVVVSCMACHNAAISPNRIKP